MQLTEARRVPLHGVALEATYATDLPELVERWEPAGASSPAPVVVNDDLARSLGIDPAVLRSEDGVAVLAAGAVPEGATPVALGYSGHQFGNLSPRLGDGRALLLGELVTPTGDRVDLHLKGSGRTPFARGGDGRATLSAMLREQLLAEAMHALGVPTTRSLAVATTGETIHRQEGPEPGAVLTRVASSHVRVGTFQYAVLLDVPGLVDRLVDHVVERHHPELLGCAPGAERAQALFAAVVEAQAALVARWMQLGFIHGVLNTDNTSIAGETIDYGPCAFLDVYDPTTVYSSIDHGGRYAFGNQPRIIHWNLARFAESLLDVLADELDEAAVVATEVLRTFPDRYRKHWLDGMRTKLGLVEVRDGDQPLVDELLDWLHATHSDWTGAFRALGAAARGDVGRLAALAVTEPARRWVAAWRARLASEGRSADEVADGMDAVNPVYVPRNHLVEEVLAAARDSGDLAPFHDLAAVLTDPFRARSGLDRFAEPAPREFGAAYRTYCGT